MNLSLAKLAPPRATHAVSRMRLFAQLDGCPVIWVHGPAGAGKSTLAASWLAQRKGAAVWLRLDAYDRDPATLITYLEAALRQASPRKRIALPRPDARERSDWMLFGRELAVAVCAGLPREACLVLDDVHELAGSAGDELLAALLTEVGARHRLLLLSRLPPAGIERALAARDLAIIDWEGLRFNEMETDALLDTLQRTDLPQARRDAAGGWAAGLVLLARSGVTEGASPAPASLSASPAMLTRYFAQQVFDGLPAVQRELLCQLAPAGEFDAAMVSALGGESAITALDALAARQVFVERHAGRGLTGWYRIHPLFCEYLLDVLAQSLSAPARSQHLVRVARLCEQAGRVERAIELLLEARAVHEAGELLTRHAADLWRAGRVQQLAMLTRQILDARDDSQADPADNGWLHFWQGMALSSTDEPASRRAFDAARLRFQACHDRSGEVLAAACATEATLGLWDSFEGLEERFAVIEHAHHEILGIADPSLRLLALAGFLDGAGHLALAQDASAAVLDQITGDLELPADPNIRLLAGAVAMAVADVMEKQDLVLDLIARLEPLVSDPVVTPFRAAYWHLHAGEILHYLSMQGQYPDSVRQARRHLALAEKSASEHQFTTLLFRVKRMKAGVAWRAGDVATAQAELDGARSLLALQKSGHRMEYHYVRSQILILQDRLDEALVEARSTVDLAAATHAPARVCAVYWTMLSTLQLRRDHFAEAREWMLKAEAASAGGHGRAYARALALIDGCEALHTGAGVEAAVQKYFSLAREMRSFHMSQFNGAQLARLAQAALAHDIETDFVRGLIKARRLQPQPPVPATWPWPVRVRVLGQSQLWLDDEPFTTSGKAQRKPLELLFWLAAQGQRAFTGVPSSQAMDALWPDLEADDPKGSLEIALHRMRKLLVLEDLVQMKDGKLSLDAQRVWTDVADFEAALDQTPQQADAVRAYAGELLPGQDQAWVLPLRERWRQRFIDHVAACGRACEARADWDAAAKVYESGLAQDNLVEDFHAGCMRAYLNLSRPAEGLRHYRRCRELLSIVLGITPSATTEALHRKLLAL